MAMTPKVLTHHTRIFAAVLLALLVLTVLGAVEALHREPVELVESTRRPCGEAAHVTYFLSEQPSDPTRCGEISDDVFRNFTPITSGVDVETHSERIAELVDDYIAEGCPSAIHDGRWAGTAQILGVGLVYETLHDQAAVYSVRDWNPRAADLVPAATTTFNVLAPEAMCAQALRQTGLADGETNELTPLVSRCVTWFGHTR